MRASAAVTGRHDAGIARHLLSILALPCMNAVLIPSLILGFEGGAATALDRLTVLPTVGIVVASALLAAGLLLVMTSIRLFASQGHGTLAPWDPPQRLVVAGAYRHVRNPMKVGLIAILAAEALLLDSPALATWFAIFATVNVVYIRVSEEPGLRRRFGLPYSEYCATVPAWIPRLASWSPPTGADEDAGQGTRAARCAAQEHAGVGRAAAGGAT